MSSCSSELSLILASSHLCQYRPFRTWHEYAVLEYRRVYQEVDRKRKYLTMPILSRPVLITFTGHDVPGLLSWPIHRPPILHHARGTAVPDCFQRLLLLSRCNDCFRNRSAVRKLMIPLCPEN